MIEQHPSLRTQTTTTAPAPEVVTPAQEAVTPKVEDSAILTASQEPSTPVETAPVNTVPEATTLEVVPSTPETIPETVTPSPSTENVGGTVPTE